MMTQKQKERWQKMRAKGERYYILVYGVGVPLLGLFLGAAAWRLTRLFLGGTFFEGLDTIAIVSLGLALIGSLRAGREGRSNEQEFTAQLKAEEAELGKN